MRPTCETHQYNASWNWQLLCSVRPRARSISGQLPYSCNATGGVSESEQVISPGFLQLPSMRIWVGFHLIVLEHGRRAHALMLPCWPTWVYFYWFGEMRSITISCTASCIWQFAWFSRLTATAAPDGCLIKKCQWLASSSSRDAKLLRFSRSW